MLQPTEYLHGVATPKKGDFNLANVESLRPKSVTVICALWLIGGLGNGASSLLGLIGTQQTKLMVEGMGDVPPEAAEQFTYVIAGALVICAASFAGALSAGFLLALRAWARTVLEILNWGMVLLVSAMALAAMKVNAAAGIVFLLGALPFVLMALKLRSRVVHEAIYRAKMREVTATAQSRM